MAQPMPIPATAPDVKPGPSAAECASVEEFDDGRTLCDITFDGILLLAGLLDASGEAGDDGLDVCLGFDAGDVFVGEEFDVKRGLKELPAQIVVVPVLNPVVP